MLATSARSQCYCNDDEIANGNEPKPRKRATFKKRSQRNDDSSEDGDMEEDVETEGDEREEETAGNTGWADAMLRVLKSDIPSTVGNSSKSDRRDGRRRKTSVILSRGKTDREVAETNRKRIKNEKTSAKKDDFEIERAPDASVLDRIVSDSTTAIQNTRSEKPETENSDDEIKSHKELLDLLWRRRLERKCWEDMGRVKPDVTNREKERFLQKVATAGVVQLFNAVKQRQTTVETKLKKVGGSEIKREKVLKSMTKQDFLDVLKKAKSIRSPLAVKSSKNPKMKQDSKDDEKSEANPTWEVLREDYMMGAQMKDWDKASDTDDNGPDFGDVPSVNPTNDTEDTCSDF